MLSDNVNLIVHWNGSWLKTFSMLWKLVTSNHTICSYLARTWSTPIPVKQACIVFTNLLQLQSQVKHVRKMLKCSLERKWQIKKSQHMTSIHMLLTQYDTSILLLMFVDIISINCCTQQKNLCALHLARLCSHL